MRRDDWLLHQLPVAMTEDEFLVRFVTIFQEIGESILQQVDDMPHQFDPTIAAAPMVRGPGSSAPGSSRVARAPGWRTT